MSNTKLTKLFSGETVCSSRTVVDLKLIKYGDNSIDVTLAHDDEKPQTHKVILQT